jgi:quercetin dioxygenase-like cupin family protein
MQVKHYDEVEAKEVEMEGASRCKVRWLVSEKDGAPNFAMRQFELEPGGHTPRHFHPYEHEIYVLEGEGAVVDGDRQRPLKPGDVVFVQPNDVHQFKNTGAGVLKMICLIPNSAAGKPVTAVADAAAC